MKKLLSIIIIVASFRAFPVFAGPDAAAGLSLLSINNLFGLGDFSGAADNLFGLASTALADPEPLIDITTDTGMPLVQGVAPILEVLMNDPAGLADFIFEENGSILAPSLSGVPPVPVLNRGLDGL